MNKIQIVLIVSYLVMTCYFFSNWLRFQLRHPVSSPEEKFLSFVMFIITTLLWPVVIPFSCLEMLKTKKLELSTVIPVIVAVSAVSIALYIS